MTQDHLLILGIMILGVIIGLTLISHVIAYYEKTEKEKEEVSNSPISRGLQQVINSKNLIYAGMVLCFLTLLMLAFLSVTGSIYEGHFFEWMNIIVRWLHITFGIAWIGTSFLFVFMENSLHSDKDTPAYLKGNLWMVHGGGFYYVEKYKVAPKVIPRDLHWFKYEAYFTWLSGFMLLFVVYYFNPTAMLVDPNVWDIPGHIGVFIGIGSLAAGYLCYDLLCRTPLLKRPLLFGLVGFVVLTGFAYFYTQVFSARAAYIHFGALIGTMMAGNVFFVIIPSQKALVQAAKDGTPLDPWLGQYAGLRSFHNNYFTLPVLFVMISNHFPSTFGHEHPWAILAALSLASAGVKHYFNVREKGGQSYWVMPVAIVMLMGIVLVTAPVSKEGACNDEVTFTEIYPIFQSRCVSCHSARPTDKVYTAPPNGVKYDTPQEIQKMAEKIMLRVVLTETMPQNNSTGMLPEERERIRCWLEQGAKIE